MKEGGFTI